MEWLRMVAAITTVLALFVAIPSAIVAIQQYRGRQREKERADRAELVGSRRAHERLVSIQDAEAAASSRRGSDEARARRREERHRK